MKTKNAIKEEFTPGELVDAYVFRNELTTKQSDKATSQLAEARNKLKGESTDAQMLYARVLQLRFQMEDYGRSNRLDESLSFAYFLKQYIKLKYTVNKDFAEDIQLDKTELSSILNKHRLPSEKTLIRLELHSGNLLPATSWYRLLEKEKVRRLQSNTVLRKSEDKFVKNRLVFE